MPKSQVKIRRRLGCAGHVGARSPYRVAGGERAHTQNLPSWNRLDASARFQFDLDGRSYTLRARVDNLTDKSYWASAGGSQAPAI